MNALDLAQVVTLCKEVTCLFRITISITICYYSLAWSDWNVAWSVVLIDFDHEEAEASCNMYRFLGHTLVVKTPTNPRLWFTQTKLPPVAQSHKYARYEVIWILPM